MKFLTKIGIVGLILVVLGLSVLVSCPAPTPTPTPAPTEKFEWRFFMPGPPVLPFAKLYTQFCDEVREQSDGQLDITPVYLGQVPYKAADELAILRNRTVEMGAVWDVHQEGVEDWLGVMTMPTIFSNMDEAIRINREVVTPFIVDVFREHQNCFPICRIVWNVNQIFSAKKLESLADVKGQKIRAAPPSQQQMLGELGAIPTYLDAPEVYAGMQRGTLDGGITGAQMADGMGWFEICKWMHMWNITYATDMVCVNVEAFNELPKELQDLLVKVGEEFEEKGQNEAKETTLAAHEKAESLGVTITELSDSDRSRLAQVGDTITKMWLEESGRSIEAKEIYRLIVEAKK